MERNDPNRLREVEIRRLADMAELAYRNAKDTELTLENQQVWHRQYTNTVLALNQLLKDSQYKEYEERLRAIEEYDAGNR